jgi:hypothetical protein
MKILAIDPGGMNGIAWFGDNHELAGYAQVKLEELPKWLNDHDPRPDLIVYENFRLWKHKAVKQSGSDMPASQAVGMIKSYASIYGVSLVDQSPQILATAQKMTQMFMPSDHSQSHWVSAYNHGMWYLIQQGHRKVEMGDLA